MNAVIICLRVSAIFLFSNLAYAAPSFDCKKASSKIEHSICSSVVLAELDLKLSELYKNNLHQSKNKKTKDDQNIWIKNRNAKCSADASELCLKPFYEERIKALEGMAKPTQADAKIDDVWSMLKEKSGDYFSASLTKHPMDREKYIFLAINSKTREVLIAVVSKQGDKLSLISKVSDDFTDENIEPEQSVLSDISIKELKKLNPMKLSLLAIYSYNSTSTHCGSEKLVVYELKKESLVQTSERILNQSCE